MSAMAVVRGGRKPNVWRGSESLAPVSLISNTVRQQLPNEPAKANLLASFFSAQCSNEDQAPPSCGAPFPLPPNHPLFEFPPISEGAVLAHFQQLSHFKASGASPINNQVLREIALFISPSLTYLFNLSIRTCRFPAAWKGATVIPLYKQRGSPSSPSNYRPVSLLPAIGKALDCLQSAVLLRYLVKNHLITPHQYGFLPGRSTNLQLVCIVDKWL